MNKTINHTDQLALYIAWNLITKFLKNDYF